MKHSLVGVGGLGVYLTKLQFKIGKSFYVISTLEDYLNRRKLCSNMCVLSFLGYTRAVRIVLRDGQYIPAVQDLCGKQQRY